MKNLVIVPHGDDEVLGLGGYILEKISRHDEFCVVYVAVGRDEETADQRESEIRRVLFHLGASQHSILFRGKDGMMDQIPDKDLVSMIEDQIDRFRPDRIFLPYKSHHQDHKKVYDCGMAAVRLRNKHFVPFVALYEYPFVGNSINHIEGGRMYFDITDWMEKKVKLFYYYESQVKEPPSPLNEEGIQSLARLRGLESGTKYAEMFYIQRLVV